MVQENHCHSGDEETLEKLKSDLTVKIYSYDFSTMDDFNSYVGIKIKNRLDGSIKMPQLHICMSFVDSIRMSERSHVFAPSSGKPCFNLVSEYDNSLRM